MTTDPRAALDRLVAALEAHLQAASTRRGEADPAVAAAYQTLADAFESYDDALYSAYDEVTPFVLYDDATEDDEDEDEDDEDEGIDEDDFDDDDLDGADVDDVDDDDDDDDDEDEDDEDVGDPLDDADPVDDGELAADDRSAGEEPDGGGTVPGAGTGEGHRPAHPEGREDTAGTPA